MKKYILAVLILLVVAGITFSILAVTGVVNLSSAPAAETEDQLTKGQNNKSGGSGVVNNSATSNTNKSEGSSTINTGDNNSVSLLAPSGDFVSDHHPNLSGSPAPNTITSVCNTSPGASCKITFTMGGTVESLPSEVTDSGGAAYWNNWTLQSVGLTSGTWKVEAIASLDGQNRTATDPMSLVVSP